MDIIEALKYGYFILFEGNNRDFVPWYNKIPDEMKDDPYTFISFTDLEKLGINPSTQYDTPAGIYCYPFREMYNYFKTGDSSVFAIGKKYIQVFRLDKTLGHINDISALSKEDAESYVEKLMVIYKDYVQDIWDDYTNNVLSSYSSTDYGRGLWYCTHNLAKRIVSDNPQTKSSKLNRLEGLLRSKKISNDDALKIIKDNADSTILDNLINDEPRYKDSPLSLLSMYDKILTAKNEHKRNTDYKAKYKKALSKYLEKHPNLTADNVTHHMLGLELYQPTKTSSISNNVEIISKWNSIFRKDLDIQFVVERSASGIIHKNEPIQAVVFSKLPIKDHITILNNRTSMNMLKETPKVLTTHSTHETYRYILNAFSVLSIDEMKELYRNVDSYILDLIVDEPLLVSKYPMEYLDTLVNDIFTYQQKENFIYTIKTYIQRSTSRSSDIFNRSSGLKLRDIDIKSFFDNLKTLEPELNNFEIID